MMLTAMMMRMSGEYEDAQICLYIPAKARELSMLTDMVDRDASAACHDCVINGLLGI